METERAPEPEDRELAARLAAFDEEWARSGSADPREFTSGLPPDAAARMTGALEGLTRLHAEWSGASRSKGLPCTFGKFLIEKELGRGGHGIVFLAVDPALDRRLALKIPRPELLDEPDWRRRFLREAHVLARLDHPGLVAVLEVGEVDGVCFIASTYCEGPNLTDWLEARTSPPNPRESARIASLIAEAVGHAHGHGVVHRDLKPRNILMQPIERCAGPNDPGPRPRVTDFGLAKVLEAQAELTKVGTVLGTPRYMAPEQKAGRNDLVSPRTDVYAIGMILQEMLIGHQPMRDSASQLDSAAGDELPESEPIALPEQHAVPHALRAIVAKCVEPQPAHRYADGIELAADLNRFLTGEPVHAARFSPRAILARAREHGTLTAAILAMGAVLAVGMLFAFGRRQSDLTRLHSAVIPERTAAVARGLLFEQKMRYVADMQLLAELAPPDLAGSTYKLPQARALLDRYRSPGPEGDLRTWEWYHFERMLHGERATVTAHTKAVYHLAYSPDGARVATSGEDGARVWNAATGAVELTFREHTGSVNWIGFSPDATKLATTSDDTTVRVFSARDGQRLLPPLAHHHKVVVVLFTPDGRQLISGDRDAIVTTWNSTTGTPVGSHKVADEPLEGMDLSPDGSILAVAASHEVTLWDYPAMKRRAFRLPSEEPPARFDCVAFSHDGRWFATAGGARDRQVRIWETQSGRLVQSFTHHADERVLTVAFSPDDRLLLSTASDDATRIWDVVRGECVAILAGHLGWVWSGGFAPDGKSIATGDGHGVIKLWDVPNRNAVTHFTLRSDACLAATYSLDGRSLYVATASGRVLAWDALTGQPRGPLPFRSPKSAVDAALAAGAELIAVADVEGTLSIGSLRVDGPTMALRNATSARPCLALSGNEKYLAFVAADGSLARLAIGERDARPEAMGSVPCSPASLAITNDGGIMAGLTDGRLFAIPARGGPASGAGDRAHQGRVACLAVSPDQSLCATAGDDASIALWDPQTLRMRARWHGRDQAIDALAFTNDCQTLVSSADQVAVCFWNVATNQPTFALREVLPSTRPTRLAVARNGSAIAALVNGPTDAQGISFHAAGANGKGQ